MLTMEEKVAQLLNPGGGGRLSQPAPQPQQQTLAQSMANSPGWAQAAQAIQNIGNLRAGRPVQKSAVQAYQEHIDAKQRRLALEEQRKRQEEELELRRMATQIQMMNALKPQKQSAFGEKRDAALSAMGLDPKDYDARVLASPEFQTLFESFGSGPLVDMGTQTEDAWEQNTLSRNIETYNQMKDDASRARGREERLNTMLTYSQLFEGGGDIGNLQQWAVENLSALGFDVAPQASARQLFDALATQNQFERTQLLKGSISEKELGLAGLMDSTSRNTREGREYILNYRIAEARRGQQLEDAAEAWMERTGQRYDERAFMRSPEYKSLRDTPMVTARLVELGQLNHPEAFKNYVKNPDTGEWFLIVPDEEGGEKLQGPLDI